MQGVIGLDAQRAGLLCNGHDRVISPNSAGSHGAPRADGFRSLQKGVLVIFEVQDVRPDDLDAARTDVFLQRQFGFCLQADSCLRLVVEWAVETTKIGMFNR